MLCGACDKIFSNARKVAPGSWIGTKSSLFDYHELPNAWAGSHHTEQNEFLQAADHRCYICSTLFRDCNTTLREQAYAIRTFYQLRLVDDYRSSQPAQEHFELEFTFEVLHGKAPIAERQVVDCSGVFKIVPKNEVQAPGHPLELTENTFDGKCEEQIRSWLTNCCKNHESCKQDWRTAGSSPTRLLHINEEEGKLHLKSFNSGDERPRYATLSHCWRAGMTTKLTANTYEQLEQGLPVSDLPPRFRDAASITLWMDVHYLWIDALCIIQDSEEDWLLESVRMGDIYTNSYCNIAATSADTNKGCFTRRYIEMVEPYSIPSPRADDIAVKHVIGYDDFWSNSLLDTTLHTRGWVLQERLLSPRTIHFGQEQMFWECRTNMACEAYPESIPDQFRNWRTQAWRQSDQMLDPARKTATDHSVHQRFVSHILSQYVLRFLRPINTKKPFTQPTWAYGVWSKTIERYMECELSFQEDKLVAISGIAQKLAELTNERYLAGLWDNAMLPQSLLWYVLGRRKADSTNSVRCASAGSPNYRAPSWSWASLEARIIWNWPAECKKVLVNIVQVSIKEKSGSKMSRISSAKMNVRGHTFEARVHVANQAADGLPEEDGRYTLHLSNKYNDTGLETAQQLIMEPTIYLDTPLMPAVSSIETHLLPLCTDWRGRSGSTNIKLAGLLLRKARSSTSEVQYERLGIFGLDQRQASALCGIESGKTDDVEGSLNALERQDIVLV